MAATSHAASTRSSNQTLSLKTTYANSPGSKPAPRQNQKSNSLFASLSLQTLVGTTTSSPPGFSYHSPSRTFALCAGSVIVLATLDRSGVLSQRFFKARPAADAVNPITSFYTSAPTNGTLKSRRRSLQPSKSSTTGASSIGSPLRERSDARTWTARERIKACSSVSLSPDGRFLAVGETGYSPRVLIFSTAQDVPNEIPLSIVTDHSFGVRCVAFSPDSQYLATLGEANDGFLFIWMVNTRTGAVKLHSTNKCTTTIHDMAWCGYNLITVGTRHVKVWRVIDPSDAAPAKHGRFMSESDLSVSPTPKALSGRNCLLGSLVDSTFTCVATLSNHEAIFCTSKGEVCLLGDVDGSQEFKIVKKTRYGIYSASSNAETEQVWFGGRNGRIEKEDFHWLRERGRSSRFSSLNLTLSPSGPSTPALEFPSIANSQTLEARGDIVALGWASEQLITVDSDCTVQIQREDIDASTRAFSSHRDAVHGLTVISGHNSLGDFFTWSRTGSVRFWDLDGKLRHSTNISLGQIAAADEDCGNELRVLRVSPDHQYFISGDRFGVVKVETTSDMNTVYELRAHGAEITDISVQHSKTLLIATCGRDRMVQLFQNTADTWGLIQTMNDHVGAVGHVLFANDGKRLLSSSSDRTVIVRERIMKETENTSIIAYLSTKIITLKASPISITLVPDEPDLLAVSTMDRHVLKLNIGSGAQVDCFKVADPENDDTVIMNSLRVSWTSPQVLVGFSSTDKSIRVYDFNRNVLLTRESGHTEGISDLALREEVDSGKAKRTVISTGLDGIIMIWDLALQNSPPALNPLQELSQVRALHLNDSDSTPVKQPGTLRPPVRKILSKIDLASIFRPDSEAGSPPPFRDQSPPRLQRKKSQYTIAAERTSLSGSPSFSFSIRTPKDLKQSKLEGRSSPPTTPLQRSRKQRSPGVNDSRSKFRSPSPPPTTSSNTPVAPTSQTPNSANNARLRHPPSVPANLRTIHILGNRGISVDASDDTEVISVASKQICQRLREYRKKMAAAANVTEPLQLDDVEVELLATLRSVAKRKSQRIREKACAGADADFGSLPASIEMHGLGLGKVSGAEAPRTPPSFAWNLGGTNAKGR